MTPNEAEHPQAVLGTTVRDSASGFAGKVTGVIHYLGGSARYLVQPPANTDGSWREPQWIEASRLFLHEEP